MLVQGAMSACQDPSGNLLVAEYLLPPGQYINRTWCQDSSVQVTTSAYHSEINVQLPSYTPQKE